MQIDLSFTNTTPATAIADFNAAAQILDNLISDNITINIQVGWSGSGGGASAGPANGASESYSTVYSYLTGHATAGDTTFTGLPNATSINGVSQINVGNPELKLMGLLSPNDTTTDDARSHFATDISSSLLIGVALHEFTHALGRAPNGWYFNAGGPAPSIFDLFDYTGVGSRNLSGSFTSSYFSLNNGVNKWADYSNSSDQSDFQNPPTSNLTPEDPFNAFYDNGTLQYLTPADMEQLDALGYHLNHFEPGANPYDFKGNNNGDVLLQNGSGNIVYANMTGGTFQNWVSLANVPGYTVEGQGKISGSLDSNVVIENGSGQILYGNVVNGTVSNWVTVANAPGFNVVGVADINGDHHDDIVIENSSGVIDYANMANGTFHGWVGLGSAPGYTVSAVADINGDGFADVVIQSASGSIAYGNMANGVFNGWVGVASTPGWTVVGAGNIQRDGFADIVIQNHSTGAIAYADMDNGVFNGWVGVTGTPGWNVIAVEDVMGNGYSDIVVQNPGTGAIAYANMAGGTFQGWVSVGSAPGYSGAPTGPASLLPPFDPGLSAGLLPPYDPGPSGLLPPHDPGPAGKGASSISDFAQHSTSLLVQGMAAFRATAAVDNTGPAAPGAQRADQSLFHAGGH